MKKFIKTIFSSRSGAGPSTRTGNSARHVGTDSADAGGGRGGSNSSSGSSGKNDQNSRGSGPSSLKNEPLTFELRIDTKMWPVFDLRDDPSNSMGPAGKLLLDFTERLASHWAAGADVGPYFGRPIFESNTNGIDAGQLPPLLFDLVQNRVVRSSAVSHVWGPTTDIDGLKYGNTLLQILEAARVVAGERYIWMDILCLDQRKRNELEIAKMKSYYANATGCFVWLDNSYDNANWHDVLNAIKKVNSFFKLDQHGSPLPGSLDDTQEFFKMETAPWFRRVWTLPGRPVHDRGAHIWTIAGLYEVMAGTAFTHQLQRSEIYKLLTLRRLYRQRQISYWHLAQADRVFGVCDMIHKTDPIINYNRSIEGLYEDLYKIYIDDGDFSPCQFLRGRSLLPDKDVSMGYVRPIPVERSETHSLALTRSGLRMGGIGIDRITKVHCILGWDPLEEWWKRFPDFLGMPFDAHFDLARAFGLEAIPHNDSQLCPASFAAYLALQVSKNDDGVMELFGKAFGDLLYNNIPPALLQWIRAAYLTQNRKDSALTMIWTQSGGVQLAVVTEPVEGNVLAVMPSSYRTEPGPGCLICQVLPNGCLKKIGIGLGNACKASELRGFLLAN
ncbi:heterokaryon incompatibility protein-domain-containing protein [Corynascus novoguineensis]|uniref:Heterokaryon incompatibility protein-domain-containing protein n=1 Tax=Corynascus novoguineensis TaxID=1126955 RepID=A0AAN7HGP1_9PEZI|nr:heterokaryon incompatibility protein-domain-containing protein [Corynascus novoguineensis]